MSFHQPCALVTLWPEKEKQQKVLKKDELPSRFERLTSTLLVSRSTAELRKRVDGGGRWAWTMTYWVGVRQARAGTVGRRPSTVDRRAKNLT